MTDLVSRPTDRTGQGRLLFTDAEWTFDTLERTYDAIEEIAIGDLGLSVYANQIEIISSEQMLDAYCSTGLPINYGHWSFGKRFIHEEKLYRKGYQGLAYEIVINSDPCISYYMEENSMAMQTLVLAHAAFGHNHFFKNNQVFREWTDASSILDYLDFARRYVAACEERHGVDAVESVLDGAHALMDQGLFRVPRRKNRDDDVVQRTAERLAFEERAFRDLWRTVPGAQETAAETLDTAVDDARRELRLPEENLLYFLEKHSPSLAEWQRELIRIVRVISQYFYPQRLTKMMNEGCATFVHYTIVNELFDRGLIDEGALFEILHSHTNVVFQPAFDDPRSTGGLNPYALGFGMMRDIQRICVDPTDEDRAWFPEIAGCGAWLDVLKEAWAEHRDESFVRQYLSPALIRELRLFVLRDDTAVDHYAVSAIHDVDGYEQVRSALADSFDPSAGIAEIQVVDADLLGDRRLELQHRELGVPLAAPDADEVVAHVERLWGYGVALGVSRRSDIDDGRTTTAA